jgi:tryptophan-rich sensory protein
MTVLLRLKGRSHAQWLHDLILGLSVLVLFFPNILSLLPNAFFDGECKQAKFLLNIEYFQRMSDFVVAANDHYARVRYYCYLNIVQLTFAVQSLLVISAVSLRENNDQKPFFETFQRLFWLHFLWLVLIANSIFFDQFEEMTQKRYGQMFTFNQGSFVYFILGISFSSIFYRVASTARDFINVKNLKN